MGRFKAQGTIVRELPEVTVIFWDWKSIYVYDYRGRGVIFHRWFAPRGSYTGYWRDFRREMLRKKRLSLLKCYELAAQFDVQSIRTDRRLDLSKRRIIYRE